LDKIAITIDYEFDWGGRVKSSYAIDYIPPKILNIENICKKISNKMISVIILKIREMFP